MSHSGRAFWDTLSATGFSRKAHPTLDANSGMHFPRRCRLLAVVVLGFFARVELQHAAAVFAHGELGALQAATLARSQLGRVDLVSIGLIGKKMCRVHNTGIDVAARRLGGKTLGNRIERRQALEYATVTMRGQQLVLACEQARQIVMGAQDVERIGWMLGNLCHGGNR